MVGALVSRYDAVEMGLRKRYDDDSSMERQDGDSSMERQDGDGGGDCSDQESIWGFVMFVFSEV